ncbi:MAG TPA: RNA polymerase sigma factor [Bacteroidales bacterium]|nr:RNA polymerase sigma factor [Bacteroidales bacterium]
MPDYSDKELLTLFKNEEKRNYAFNLIVRKYQEKLYWHIRKIVIKHDDTDDILQNTFIKVWKGLDGFRENSKLYTWLYRIATNESLTFLKQKKTKYLLPIVDYENQLKETLQSDEHFNGTEIQLKLQKAILKLPEKQRIVFNMKYFEEMKYDDMAEVLNTSVGALKLHIIMQ